MNYLNEREDPQEITFFCSAVFRTFVIHNNCAGLDPTSMCNLTGTEQTQINYKVRSIPVVQKAGRTFSDSIVNQSRIFNTIYHHLSFSLMNNLPSSDNMGL